MRQYLWMILLIALSTWHCQYEPSTTSAPYESLMADMPFINGRAEYLNSPYVTAGDRLYVVGHQNGQYPDLGWHVEGEMGGIWSHPIKLMDGFVAAIKIGKNVHCLNQASMFTNFPMANKLEYQGVVPGLNVEQFQFVPDGHAAVVIGYLFENTTQKELKFDFQWSAMVDLRPVWLGERTGMIDSPDTVGWDGDAMCAVAKDSNNDWYTAWNADKPAKGFISEQSLCDFERKGQGATGTLSYPINVKPGSAYAIQFVVAGSDSSEEEAVETLKTVQNQALKLLQAKVERYQQLATTAKISIPDSSLQQAYEWVKYNTDWLIRDVTDLGRGLSAGIPDYPWWFGCDNTYTLQGVLATGRTDIVYSTLDLLKKLSEVTNGNGRIIHEASTNGAVFNPGNINETPHFASMVWTVYEWTGDREFLESYYPLIEEGLQWLLNENDADGNFLPDGFGMMEIHGLDSEMIDVAVYTQQAFADAARMASALGDKKQATDYQEIADQLAKIINKDFWVPEFNSYADFIGTAAEARHLIDDAIIRADTLGKPWAVAELKATKDAIAHYPDDQKQGFVLYHNWVVNTPMETGIAEHHKALAALETGSQFVNPFGVFVTGIDRDESAGSDVSSFAARKKVFSYVGAVMTLPTGVQAIAENNYRRPNKALEYLQRMVRSFSFALPGSMYEVSPDFGMMTQAWNTYALAVPLVQQFFGVQPKAYDREIHLQPLWPDTWPEGSLENLKIADNQISVSIVKKDNRLKILVQQQSDWAMVVRFPAGLYSKWKLDGEAASPELVDEWQELRTSALQAEFELIP